MNPGTGAPTGNYTESKVGYYVTGAAAISVDAAGRKSSVSYADSFYQNVNRTDPNPQNQLKTYAYPTTVTDPDGFTATTVYNYDMGVATQAQTPLPGSMTNQPGPVTKSYFDGAGRRTKVTNSVNGAHTEWAYDANMELVRTYTTVADDSAQNLSNRLYSAAALDGLGRVRGTAHDFLSSAGQTPAWVYSAQLVYYDSLGRAAFRSNPTEMQIVSGTWTPAGDDANGGVWRGTSQTYDWKGRPKVTTNPDGSQWSADYSGCGCAGGEVVTLTDEVGRSQKVYSDVLGRQWKTEVLNSNGSVYSTTEATLNALDQATFVRQYQETDQSGVFQETANTYDGYGRLQTRHAPEQDAGRSTTYSYNQDDTVASMKDARGAKALYGYNNRRLLTSIGYDISGVPSGQNVTAASNVTYNYDGTGRRTQMTDALGTVVYSFDALGRLSSESRTITDPSNTSVNGSSEPIFYDYNLGGELKYVRDPFGSQVDYQHDRAGRLTGVTTNTPYGNVSTYASGIQYRAWGALRGLTYGNLKTLSLGYNSRLQVESYNIPGIINNQYRYTTTPTSADNDGRVKFVQDLTQVNSQFDRAYRYDDPAGRLTEALTGSQARGGNSEDGPYYESYGYDVWDQSTSLTRRDWDTTIESSLPLDGTHGRTTAWSYDADGRVIANDRGQTYKYDAAGRVSSTTYQVTVGNVTQTRTRQRTYDGDGRVAREVSFGLPTYSIRSTALGGATLTEVSSTGQKKLTNVYASGEMLAVQSNDQVIWQHQTPFDTSDLQTNSSGAEVSRAVLNPTGVNFGTQPPPPPEEGPDPDLVTPRFGDPLAPSGIMVDGFEVTSLTANMFMFSMAARGSLPGALGGTGTAKVTTQDYVWQDDPNDTQTINDRGGAVKDADGNPVLAGANVTITSGAGYFAPILGAITLQTTLMPQKSDCAKFVDELVDLAVRGQNAGPGAEVGTGRGLALSAKNYYSKSKGPNGENLFGIEGFKDIRTDAGDVSKWFLGHWLKGIRVVRLAPATNFCCNSSPLGDILTL